MTRYRVPPATRELSGRIVVPGDKSIGHRALLFGLLGTAPVRVTGLGNGADNGRSAKAATALGARVVADGASLVIRGPGLRHLRAPAAPIDCGNSGTTIRMLCGLLAGQPFATTLVGDESLSKRPMRRLAEPLQRMGARFVGGGGGGELVPPLTVGPASGALTAIDYVLPMASAQVKTAVLLAGLYADGVTRVTEPGPSRDHTERMLAYLGAPISRQGRETSIDTRGWDGTLRGGDVTVPGDPSSSAFLVIAALLVGAGEVAITDVCVNPTRTGFLDVLAAMGAQVAVVDRRSAGSEDVATIVVRGGAAALTATEVAGDLIVRCIDEVPVLAVAAARARGRTVFRDADELRVKESDRIATTLAMLRGFGVACGDTEDGNGFWVDGQPTGAFTPAMVDAAGDHRIAMAGAIAALLGSGPSQILDADNVATSYPGFVATMNGLGAAIEVESDA